MRYVFAWMVYSLNQWRALYKKTSNSSRGRAVLGMSCGRREARPSQGTCVGRGALRRDR